MMTRLLLIAMALCTFASAAFAHSTINPTEPQQGMPYNSATVRNNFQAGANDINGLQTCNYGATPPSAPNTGYCWLNTGNAALWCYELWNGVLNTWTPVFSINPLSQVVTFGLCTVTPPSSGVLLVGGDSSSCILVGGDSSSCLLVGGP